MPPCSFSVPVTASATPRKKCPYLEFSGPYFPAFGLNAEKYGVTLRIQSKCEKIRTRKYPNTDTFHTVRASQKRK